MPSKDNPEATKAAEMYQELHAAERAVELEQAIHDLEQVGINTGGFSGIFKIAQSAAARCDIEKTLLSMMEIDKEITYIHQEIRRQERRPHNRDMTSTRRGIDRIEEVVVEHILGTLKAKQCKCG